MNVFSQSLQALIEGFLLFLPRLVVALIVFFAGLFLSGWLARSAKFGLQKRETDPELELLLVRLTRWSVAGLGLIVALQQVNFDLTGFLAGLGIVGFTIGFALQDVSKNFIAGILLLLQQPFDIGDAIEVDGHSGTVTSIDIRATEIRTFDGVHLLIPNGDVYVKAIKNYSRATRRRLELAIGVACDSDLDLVTQTLQTALGSIPGVITDDPAPQVVFKSFGESTIDLTAYFWIDLTQIGYLDAQDRSVKVAKRAFEQASIDMPFPTRTILMPQRPA